MSQIYVPQIHVSTIPISHRNVTNWICSMSMTQIQCVTNICVTNPIHVPQVSVCIFFFSCFIYIFSNPTCGMVDTYIYLFSNESDIYIYTQIYVSTIPISHFMSRTECPACRWRSCWLWYVWRINALHRQNVTNSMIHLNVTHWKCCRLIAGTPPPRGSFFLGWFPNQEPGGGGSPMKNHPQNWSILGWVLQGESSSSGFLIWNPPNKETPPGGGGFFRSMCVAICRYTCLTYVCSDVCV